MQGVEDGLMSRKEGSLYFVPLLNKTLVAPQMWTPQPKRFKQFGKTGKMGLCHLSFVLTNRKLAFSTTSLF